MDSEYLPPNPHPGEMLLEDYMKPLGITVYRLATDIKVPISRIDAITKSKRSILPDTALRLSRYFGMSPEFWSKAQAHYELMEVRRSKDREIEQIIPFTDKPKSRKFMLASK